MPRKARDPYASLPKIDPRGGDLYFGINYEDYNVDDSANDPDSSLRELARSLNAEAKLGKYPETYFRLENEAQKNAQRLLGASVTNYGHNSFGDLDAHVSVENYADLERMIDSIGRADQTLDYATIGLGDSPFHVARGFMFYPEGVNGPQYEIAEIAEMIEERKPKKTAKRKNSR